jgi:gas vesicle protein
MFKRRKKNPIVSLLIGGVIGGAAALFMAPASGRETRNSIGSGVNRMLYRANDQKNNMIRSAQRISNDILVKSAEIYNKSLGAAEGTFTASADSIELEIRSFKNAVNAAYDAYKKTKSGIITGETGLENEIIINQMHSDFEDETLPKQEGMGRRQE